MIVHKIKRQNTSSTRLRSLDGIFLVLLRMTNRLARHFIKCTPSVSHWLHCCKFVFQFKWKIMEYMHARRHYEEAGRFYPLQLAHIFTNIYIIQYILNNRHIRVIFSIYIILTQCAQFICTSIYRIDRSQYDEFR